MATAKHGSAPLARASAPGKIILMGEHAVVHGMSALAVPVGAVSVDVTVRAWDRAMGVVSEDGSADPDAPTLCLDVASAPADDPWATAVRLALRRSGHDSETLPSWRIGVESTVPVGGGMGSSAALAVALARAVSQAAGANLDDETISEVAFEAEKLNHGTPSGIDNAVVAFSRPIEFVSGSARPLSVARPIHLVVASAGTAPPTRRMVAGVHDRSTTRPITYDRWFRQIDALVRDGARAVSSGDLATLGRMMDTNHLILQAMRVSTGSLDRLVAVARSSGALGAKLSGAGGGGIVVALATAESAEAVEASLRDAGAVRTIHAIVEARQSMHAADDTRDVVDAPGQVDARDEDDAPDEADATYESEA